MFAQEAEGQVGPVSPFLTMSFKELTSIIKKEIPGTEAPL